MEMSPAKFSRLVGAWNKKQRREDMRAAFVAATVINVRLKPGARMIAPGELLDGETEESDG